jgi:hypothetical protein
MAEVEVAHRPPGYVRMRVDGDVNHGTRTSLLDGADGCGADGTATAVDLCGVRSFSLADVDRADAATADLAARGRPVPVVCARGPAAPTSAAPNNYRIAEIVAGSGCAPAPMPALSADTLPRPRAAEHPGRSMRPGR